MRQTRACASLCTAAAPVPQGPCNCRLQHKKHQQLSAATVTTAMPVVGHRLQGYTFYLAIFYILVAILFISVAICIWVGWCFMNDNFPFLWPIKVARVVVSLFVTMFYIASLNIFLTACTCNKVDGKWKHMYFKLGKLGDSLVGGRCFSAACSRRSADWLLAGDS